MDDKTLQSIRKIPVSDKAISIKGGVLKRLNPMTYLLTSGTKLINLFILPSGNTTNWWDEPP
ncbi:MAG: hypothetical protein HDKAJFGB_02316 [Anaerolineae bacterium]|nr:hypothetical protein [Anaerolineae bacterium]